MSKNTNNAKNVETTPETPTNVPTTEQIAEARKLLSAAKSAGIIGRKRSGTRRIDCINDVLSALPVGGLSFDEIGEKANTEYVSVGGEDNVKQTLHYLSVVLPTVLAFAGVEQVGKDRLRPVPVPVAVAE